LKELERIKKQVLRVLIKGPATFWELVNFQDAHLSSFLEALKDLLKEGTISYAKPYFQLVKPSTTLNEFHDPGCLFCQPFQKDPFWKEILEKFKELTEKRPLPTSEYDQGFITPEDTLKRVAFIYLRGDLEDNEVFLLGDDDLLSIAMALTRLPKRIVVVEIDERINQFILETTQKLGFKDIEVYNYNVIEALPVNLRKSFDVFVTDPVETEKGLMLFVARCVESLKGEGGVGYVGFTHREASLRKWRDFQRFLFEAGFVLTDILRDFTTYPEKENSWEDFYRTYRVMKEFDLELPNVDWYKSCLIRFEALEEPHLPAIALPKDLEELYFDDEAWATPLPPTLEKKKT